MAEGAKLYPSADVGQMDAMQTTTVSSSQTDAFALPAPHMEEHWYAAYTRANHEKRVASELHTREVDHFLPLYRSVRRWKDRRVQLELPLFPSYVFVRLALRDRLRVLEIPSVVRLVGFGGIAAELPSEQIDSLRTGLSRELRAEPHPFLTQGRRVRIRRGPLEGLEGILLRRKSSYRVVLSVDLIQRSIVADVDIADLEIMR